MIVGKANSSSIRVKAAVTTTKCITSPLKQYRVSHKPAATARSSYVTLSSLSGPQQQPQQQQLQQQPDRLRMLSLISDAVAIQAQTQRFEILAGRSAMIGVAVALVAELATESSIFKHFNAETVAALSGLFMGAVSLAAAAAFANKQRLGVELMEAVVTSLTANQRSAASITGRQVDRAVDSVLNNAFDRGVICSMLADDEDV